MTIRRSVLGLMMLAGALAAPGDADACGGCFHGPRDVTVVTDHRMVLALSRDRTTLWDQFRYSGRAEDFSWILPIRNGPGVIIEEADNNFLNAMDDVAAPQVTPPPSPFRCRDSSRGIGFGGSDSTSASPNIAPGADAGVNVLSERVVGPYQTATLAASDPMALRTWLRSNGYTVPTAIEPIIDHYVALRMDFVAVRLRPTETVAQMKPLRITTPGYNPLLPMRMISAGVADKVGVTLTVIAESRTEAMNFPNGEIRDVDLVYDYDNPTQATDDFLAAFNRLNRANNNRLWLTESAQSLSRSTVEAAVAARCQPRFGAPQPTDCVDSRVNPADARVAFQSFGDNAFVTRLRADLTNAALAQDLQVAASDRGLRGRVYSYGTLRNDPCANPKADFQGCSARPGEAGRVGLAGLCVAAVVGVSAARRRRRR